jgi:phospholipase C
MSNGVPLPGIEHVVVLMLENRSFDNVLGGLYPDLTRQKRYRGLLGTETNPLDPSGVGESVRVFQGPPNLSTWTMPYPDPGELYADMVEQIFASKSIPPVGPETMSGFAWNYKQQKSSPKPNPVAPVPKNIMQYYSHQTMPISLALAQAYAVCDCWFASGPVQTLANRVFTHCGTPSKLLNGENKSRLDNPDYFFKWDDPKPTVSDTTIFQLLDEAYPDGQASGCSDINGNPSGPLNWKVYYHDAPVSALCDYVYNNWCYDYFYGGNVWGFEPSDFDPGFGYDVANGLLPKYSYIEPCYTDQFGTSPNTNHPGGAGIDWDDENGQSLPPPIDVRDGEMFLLKVYRILSQNPEVFDKTLLIVTYDEHGGLYDHVAPPSATSPFQNPVENFNYDRYGVRVPTILINPRIQPQTIYPPRNPGGKIPDPPFDHTSILSTLIAQFGLSGSLSPRVEIAPQLVGLITPGPVAYERPPLPLVAPEALAPVPPLRVRRKRPRPVPQAHTLAGALGPLYQLIEGSRRYRYRR